MFVIKIKDKDLFYDNTYFMFCKKINKAKIYSTKSGVDKAYIRFKHHYEVCLIDNMPWTKEINNFDQDVEIREVIVKLK
jgi:hypothetical protein